MPQQSTPPSTFRTVPGSSPGAVVGLGDAGAGSGDPWATDSRLQAAVELVAGGDCSVLSLEPFDTLMWRKLPEPASRSYVLGARLEAEGLLASDTDAAAFAGLRARAEAGARPAQRAGGRSAEVTLADICARIPQVALRGITAGELAVREVELERTILVPDLDVVELGRWAVERGMRVVCVSETYFSESDLRSFLGAAPVAALRVEHVFTSSTRGVGKADGLWPIVCDELEIDPGELVHLSRGSATDVAATGAGEVRTVCFERRPRALTRIMDCEDRHAEARLSPYHGDYGLTALRSKVLQRVECARQPPELRSPWGFGAGSLGPPLAGFAEWVQHRAARAGAGRVFCMMPAGGLLAQMVNAAASSVDAPAEAEPIWLSRGLCARASIVDGTAAELRTVLRRSTMSTAGEYCATLGVDIGDVEGFEGSAAARLDDPGTARRLVAQLVREPDSMERIVAGAAELRGRIVSYLEGIRPPGEDRLVLVDLARGAPTQSLLDTLLRASGSSLRTTGLYLIGTDRIAERIPDGADVHGFLAGAGQPPPVEALVRSPEMLEQICVPARHVQLGLDRDLEPVFHAVEDSPARTTRRQAVQKGIFAFQREWIRYRTSAPGSLVPLHEYGQEWLRSILVRALTLPTADEAGVFAGSSGGEALGGPDVEPLVSARGRRYLEPGELTDSQITELLWPFDLAAFYDEQLASAVKAITEGRVGKEPWPASGRGQLESSCDRPDATAGPFGEVIRSVRVDLAEPPSSLRLEWVRLPGLGERLGLRATRGRVALLVRGKDRTGVAELRRLVGDDAHTAPVRRGFVALPLRRHLRRRVAGAGARAGIRG